MANKIYQNSLGVIVRIDMGEDISLSSNYSFHVKKPDATLITWTPSIGTNTKFYYSTIAGDLNQIGNYTIQPHFTLGAWTGYGYPISFSVLPPLL